MKCKYVWLGAIVLSISFSACNQKTEPKQTDTVSNLGDQKYSDTSFSSVRVFDQNGRVCIQKTNTYYELVEVFEANTKIPMLLKIRKTDLCYADSVDKHKVYEIEAKSVMDTKEVSWTTKMVATEISFRDNTLLAVHEGIDAEEDLLTRYSLLNGKEIFSCSYGDLKVIIPNIKQKRFVGFTSRQTATNPLAEVKRENLAGVVKYSNGVKPVDAFKIVLKRSAIAVKIPSYTPELLLETNTEGVMIIDDGKSAILSQAGADNNPVDVKGIALHLVFYYGDDNESTTIKIPITSDRLDMSKAVFDKDVFEIEPL